MRYQWRRSERPQLYVTADQVIDRLPASAVRDLLELDPGKLGEPLHRHVLWRSEATSRPVAQARLLLGQRDQFGDRGNAERRMRREHDRLARHMDDRHQIPSRIDVRVEHVRIAGDRIDRNKKGVAVWRTLGRDLNTQGAIGA